MCLSKGRGTTMFKLFLGLAVFLTIGNFSCIAYSEEVSLPAGGEFNLVRLGLSNLIHSKKMKSRI